MGPHVRLHHGTCILSPLQLRGRQSTWRHWQFHTHAVVSGSGVAQLLLTSSATAAFSRLAGRRGRVVRDGFASDLALQSSGALPLFGYSAAQWQFSPQLKQFLRLEYRSSRGDLSLGFSLESLDELPSRCRRSDISLSLRGNSLCFSSTSRERKENRDDAEERLRT